MDYAIGKVIEFTGVGLPDAITMATTNPARVGRIASRQRGLSVAERADFVRFEHDEPTNRIRILETYVSGERVYSA